MAARTSIEWTDRTWNPVRGCSRVSEGCRHCYAEGIAARFSGPGQPYEGLARFVDRPDGSREARWTGTARLVESALTEPLKWRKPARVFVNSMSDLFHESLSDEAIDKVFAVMALAPHLTFQVLTKRPERMRDYVRTRAGDWTVVLPDAFEPGSFRMSRHELRGRLGNSTPEHRALYGAAQPTWPLPNVWLGVSIEDQATADARVPILLDTPAAARFVSAEPLLGPIDFTSIDCEIHHNMGIKNALTGEFWIPGAGSVSSTTLRGVALDWVIVGGESGPGARPMHPDWARSLRDQCARAAVPFLFKQWGEWLPMGQSGFTAWSAATTQTGHIRRDARRSTAVGYASFNDGRGGPETYRVGPVPTVGGGTVARIGKRAAGRLLDGVLHDAWPEARL